MTRLASILGVATVATLVLLSGCEAAVTTDYAKDLAGTWEHGPAPATIPNPLGPTAMPATVQAMRTITVTITDDEGVNKGAFSLTVADTVAPSPMPIETAASGSFTATASEITVMVTDISPTTVADAYPELGQAPIKISYEIDGDELEISSVLLVTLRATSEAMPNLTLTKEMASTSGR